MKVKLCLCINREQGACNLAKVTHGTTTGLKTTRLCFLLYKSEAKISGYWSCHVVFFDTKSTTLE